MASFFVLFCVSTILSSAVGRAVDGAKQKRFYQWEDPSANIQFMKDLERMRLARRQGRSFSDVLMDEFRKRPLTEEETLTMHPSVVREILTRTKQKKLLVGSQPETAAPFQH